MLASHSAPILDTWYCSCCRRWNRISRSPSLVISSWFKASARFTDSAELLKSTLVLIYICDPFLCFGVSFLKDGLEWLQPRILLNDAWTNGKLYLSKYNSRTIAHTCAVTWNTLWGICHDWVHGLSCDIHDGCLEVAVGNSIAGGCGECGEALSCA